MEPCRFGVGEEVDDVVESKVRSLDVEGDFVGLNESMMTTTAAALPLSLLQSMVIVAVAAKMWGEDGESPGRSSSSSISNSSSISRFTATTLLRPPHFGDM